jgi:STE24 endopeptidase
VSHELRSARVQSEGVFSAAELGRSRRYHRPLYLALLVQLALGIAAGVLLAFAAPGDRLYGLVDGLPWWAATVAFTALIVVATAVVRMPLGFWTGYVHERNWGLSTQRPRGWLADRAKGVAVSVVLGCVTMLGLVGLARALPRLWPVAAAAGAAALVLLLSFVAPVVLEPLFHRFRPLDDEALAARLRRLAEQAGVPVREILVADASRRTRKGNAYVSGLGRTRRVVVFDTLLERAGEPEIALVVAHELAHRRARHVAKGTALAMAATAAGTVALWICLRWDGLLGAAGARGASDPRVVPLVLLLGGALELVGAPLFAALSRRWEREADRGSLELTRDPESFEAAHRRLALENVSDLEPPRLLYALFFTHPTPPERIVAGRPAAPVATVR